MNIKEFFEIFSTNCTYEKINEYNVVKLRDRGNISIIDALLYRFLYTEKNMTKERIVSSINIMNEKIITRQSFDEKEGNISEEFYLHLFTEVWEYYINNYCEKKSNKIYCVDGTYNNDKNMNEILNMGFYDITNSMPLDIKSYGKEHKNKEIQAATNYIKKNLDIFRNSILVCDRGYHSYEFCKFLDDNNIKFIIRFKGNAENLQPSKKLVKSIPNYETIMHLRNKVKTVVYNNTITKTMHSSISKKSISEKTIKIKNNCVLVTNILDKTAFNDERILEIYKTRWDIEVFFKYIKNNFKFQNLTQSSKQHYKMYLCMLIITYISLIVEKYYYSRMKSVKVKKNVTYKVNKSELVNGVFDKLLYDILMNRITIEILNNFCNIYIKIIQNKNNRTYPRTSKTPFTKWYIKGYSKLTQYNKVIDAIINGNIETLNKNLKLIAESIIAINGKKYG